MTAPSQITSDGRADRLRILSKKLPLKKGGLWGKEQNEREICSLESKPTTLSERSKMKNKILHFEYWIGSTACGMMCG